MDIKELLIKMEERLAEPNKEIDDFTGKYILFADRQEKILMDAKGDIEFAAKSIIELFRSLNEINSDAGAKVLTLLYEEYPEKKDTKIKTAIKAVYFFTHTKKVLSIKA